MWYALWPACMCASYCKHSAWLWCESPQQQQQQVKQEKQGKQQKQGKERSGSRRTAGEAGAGAAVEAVVCRPLVPNRKLVGSCIRSVQVRQGIWRQGIVLRHRNSLQKSLCPVVISYALTSVALIAGAKLQATTRARSAPDTLQRRRNRYVIMIRSYQKSIKDEKSLVRTSHWNIMFIIVRSRRNLIERPPNGDGDAAGGDRGETARWAEELKPETNWAALLV